MLKALLKKQFLELASLYLKDKKTGKMRVGKNLILFALLYAFLFIYIGFSFSSISLMLADALIPSGNGWVYYAIIGLLSVLISGFLNSLSTYSILYLSKDNELLLSFPIPPSDILLSRMLSVYVMGYIYELLVLLPGMIVYWIKAGITVHNVLFTVLLSLIIGALILVITCCVGWLVALITTKTKNNSFVTIITSLLFVGIIYYFSFKSNTILMNIAAQTEKIASGIRRFCPPFYWMGRGLTGEALPALLFAVIILVLTALMIWVLSRNFIKLITTKTSARKKIYKEKNLRSVSASTALLKKEFRKFFNCPVYLLNTGLALIMLLGFSVFALFRKDLFEQFLYMFNGESDLAGRIVPILPAVIVNVIISVSMISAPSISLEGQNIWLLKSLPIRPYEVFRSKIGLHVLLCAAPSLIGLAAFSFVFGASVPDILSSILFSFVFTVWCAVLGIVINMKKPMMEWKNEAVPIKQSFSVGVSMLIGFVSMLIFTGFYLMFPIMIPGWIYMIVFSVILAALTWILIDWLKNKGSELFGEL